MRMTVLSSLRSAGGLLRALRQRVDRLTAMLERQRRSQAQVEAFSANVAHELRTPLATLITGIELTIREGGLTHEASDRLGANLEELRRMQGIVGDMLFLSRAYGGARRARGSTASPRWRPRSPSTTTRPSRRPASRCASRARRPVTSTPGCSSARCRT